MSFFGDEDLREEAREEGVRMEERSSSMLVVVAMDMAGGARCCAVRANRGGVKEERLP